MKMYETIKRVATADLQENLLVVVAVWFGVPIVVHSLVLLGVLGDGPLLALASIMTTLGLMFAVLAAVTTLIFAPSIVARRLRHPRARQIWLANVAALVLFPLLVPAWFALLIWATWDTDREHIEGESGR